MQADAEDTAILAERTWMELLPAQFRILTKHAKRGTSGTEGKQAESFLRWPEGLPARRLVSKWCYTT